MITPTERAVLRQIIRRLVRAEVAESWKGSGPFEEYPLLEAETRAAKRELRVFLNRITRKSPR